MIPPPPTGRHLCICCFAFAFAPILLFLRRRRCADVACTHDAPALCFAFLCCGWACFAALWLVAPVARLSAACCSPASPSLPSYFTWAITRTKRPPLPFLDTPAHSLFSLFLYLVLLIGWLV
ncbi:uncharacterized protein IWZ02DRAFT_462355, partial [Phyllosticta citriasiana]|uniref:uncharacterized protein n=1 Tax=Phyllosticta citriasiana TaxID=595635 RepID=UPI0030FD8EE9